MKPKIVVTQAIFPDLLRSLEADFDVISNQENRPITSRELQNYLSKVDGALVSGLTYSELINTMLFLFSRVLYIMLCYIILCHFIYFIFIRW